VALADDANRIAAASNGSRNQSERATRSWKSPAAAAAPDR
jgi:hypothetical protein